MNLETSFKNHVAERMRAAEMALTDTGYQHLVLSSGKPYTYFRDDQDAPFHKVAHFGHWCPIGGPHHVLIIEPGAQPRLIRYAPDDYWYEQLPLGEPFWLDNFDVVECGTLDAVWEQVGGGAGRVYVGNETERAQGAGLDVNPAALLARLDWDRAYKTEYELHCLDEASKIAAQGHVAASAFFEAGESELAIHYAFVQAIGFTDAELPYPTIVALNEKAATLHYEGKRLLRDGKVLLIDAGAQIRGYASDITRTHLSETCDPRFVGLHQGMETLQQALCEAVRPGPPFGDLHHLADQKIATLLSESGVLKVSGDEAVSRGLSRPFFPHGLGHHLGLQVHDVGGHLANPRGDEAPPPQEYPHLRNTRAIEPRHVFTIEPGLYFIPMLLAPFREGEDARHFDWQLIDELTPFGGIRIEDNVVVTEDGHRNLTRPYLPN